MYLFLSTESNAQAGTLVLGLEALLLLSQFSLCPATL